MGVHPGEREASGPLPSYLLRGRRHHAANVRTAGLLHTAHGWNTDPAEARVSEKGPVAVQLRTPYAKRLGRQDWPRLSFGMELRNRGITTMPSVDVAADLQTCLLRHVATGNDVVLDRGDALVNRPLPGLP